MRYVLAQINPTVGDLPGNAARVLAALATAEKFSPDLVVFPEMTLSGYPPEDLLLKPAFLTAAELTLQNIAARVRGRAVVGYPSSPFFAGHPRLLAPLPPRYVARPRNTAAVIDDSAVVAEYHKCLLPNYAVFDEKRYFAAGDGGLVLELQNGDARQKTGVVICEDAWNLAGPVREEAAAGATVIACLSASPFYRGKESERLATFAALCRAYGIYFLYCNLVGGQDELVFDGASFALSPQGEIIAQAKNCAEDFLVIDIPNTQSCATPSCDTPSCDTPRVTPPRAAAANDARPIIVCALKSAAPAHSDYQRASAAADGIPPTGEALEPVYAALTLGLRDYVRKNGFTGVIVGLSGGIDSALTAAVAVDALGKENVWGVTMPSIYSSAATRDDAKILADNLGMRFSVLPIAAPLAAFERELTPLYAAADPRRDPENLTGQNLQARIRAVYLMALANKYGLLLLNTSNKSESAVGYGTLYGDMAGGFAVIKDVFKTEVWKLSRYVNARRGREVIPVSTIERTPSAELRENQEDRQSLPDYPILDPILKMYVEDDAALAEIIAAGFDEAVVRRVARMVDRSEFKRRQSVCGAKVTPKAFGKDRRLPVTNRFAYEEITN
ncbi:MAG: NAD+ synthase [Planctomycetota bacterium]|jgi:NAD+ synthase (glutamine-hydrolysing)|nr:NAD+ synthase [Planctomycetota bacterium]